MAVLIFVLFWVLVAIGLVVFGIRSGKRGQPGTVNTARGGRTHWYIGFAFIVLGFGIGVPIAASFGRDNDSNRVPQANINDLTDREQKGRELFVTFCSQCHSLTAASAVAQVGPNLDTLRPTAGLVKDAVSNGRARGNGAMARNLVVGQDLEDVAAFVSKAVGQDDAPAAK
jgi:mono/diheme cytochrome c family protein